MTGSPRRVASLRRKSGATRKRREEEHRCAPAIFKRSARERAMTQPSFAVGIVVGGVSVGRGVHRAKEQDGGEMMVANRRAETTERRGSWRKGGKRRKQKAIAYERQLAPLMARETKQKSEASSSNTIKPTVRASCSRV